MVRATARLSRSAGVAALAALVVGIAGPAYAGDGPTFGGSPDGESSVGFTGSDSTSHASPGSSGSTGNGPVAPSGGSDSGSQTDLWGGAEPGGPGTGSCDPANYPGGYAPGWAVPAPCIQPVNQPPAVPGAPPAPPQITVQMVTAAASATAPANPPHVEPGTVSYVNIPNNYWTESNTVNEAVTVLGRTIPLRWTPTSTTWSFGDGGTASGDGIQGADLGAPGAVEHPYGRQGSYDITTTTTYDLTFVLPGQGAQTIQLTAPASPAVTLPVREIQTRATSAY
jgi:hypothetical protein